MLVGINDLHVRATSIIRDLGLPGAAPVLVVRRHRELIATISPPKRSFFGAAAHQRVSMREFSRCTTQVLAQVRGIGAPMIVTNHGRPVAVIKLVSPEDARHYAAELSAQSSTFAERLERAEEDFQNGTAKTADQFEHLLDGGSAFDAIDSLLEDLDPKLPLGPASLGHLFMQVGDFEGAEDAYRRADDQGSGPGACNLGFLLEQRGDLIGAEAAFARADKPGDRDGAINLARMLRRHGDFKGERAAVKRAEQRSSAAAH